MCQSVAEQEAKRSYIDVIIRQRQLGNKQYLAAFGRKKG